MDGYEMLWDWCVDEAERTAPRGFSAMTHFRVLVRGIGHNGGRLTVPRGWAAVDGRGC